MTTLTLKTIAAIAIAASLGGCASNGQPVTGSQGGDFGALGTIAGIAAGYAGAKALGASNTASRNTALLAGVAGAGLLLFWFAMPETRGATQSALRPTPA